MRLCGACFGKKKVLCLGNLVKECPNCNGIGHVDEIDKNFIKDVEETMDLPKPKKKRKPNKENVLHV